MSFRIGITVSLRKRFGDFRKYLFIEIDRDHAIRPLVARMHAAHEDIVWPPRCHLPGSSGASVRLSEMLMISGEVSRYTSARSDSVVSTLSQRSCFTVPVMKVPRPCWASMIPSRDQKVDRLADGDAGNAEFGRQQLRSPAAASPAPIFRARCAAGKYRQSAHISGRDCRKSDPSHVLRFQNTPTTSQVRRRVPRSSGCVALVLAEVICGITEASITRSFSTPRTRNCGSSTDCSSLPIRQVPTQ